MKKYCIRKRDAKRTVRKVFEYQEFDSAVRLSYRGILDGIMSMDYFKENYVEVKDPFTLSAEKLWDDI
jgi:hypothetical protein